MNKKILFSLPLLIIFACSSCGANPNNPHIAKNGDLDALSEITYENAFVNATFSYMDQMIKSNEVFIFYLTSSECSHCAEFKSKILDYVKNTHHLVAMMDIITYDEKGEPVFTKDFEQFLKSYEDLFFINHEVLTPQVYIVKGTNVADKVSNSRYTTSIMFSNAMNEYVYGSNVYSFQTLDGYKVFESQNKDNLFTTVVDRTNDDNGKMYNLVIDEYIKHSDKKSALIELNDSNRNEFYEYLQLEDSDFPYLISVKESKKEQVKVTSEKIGKDFLENYLK